MGRSALIKTMRIEYPNATHFAFVPALIRITNAPAGCDRISVAVNDRQSRRTYKEEREPLGGACCFDVRRYLQIMFDDLTFGKVDYEGAAMDVSHLKRTARIAVRTHAESAVQTALTFDVDALWGAISARECRGGTVRRKWFVNYPFTLDFFARHGTMFDVRIDGGKQFEFENGEVDAAGATPYNAYLLNPAKISGAASAARTVRIAARESLILQNDAETVGEVAYVLDVDRSESGVYLRWIDRGGRYGYYLFRAIGGTTTISAAATWERNDMSVPTAYVDGVNTETPVRQSLMRKNVRSLGAKSVDAETYDFLLTLAQSVVVDVFDGYDAEGVAMWHRVNVVAGSFEKAAKRYQDFMIAIEEPAWSAQML